MAAGGSCLLAWGAGGGAAGCGGVLEEDIRDFLFDAFLHVARHDCPPLATADGENPPPTGSLIPVPAIDWGQHLVGHPSMGRVVAKGRTCYHEPNMARHPPCATPSDTKAWETETWVHWMASQSQFRDQVPGDVPVPSNQQPAPFTYMTLMYNIHYTLSATHYHARTGTWVLHGTDSLLPADCAPPSPRNPGHDMYTREDEPDDPHIWSTWERRSLDMLLSIRSRNKVLGKVMYCLAKWTKQTWRSPRTGGCGRSNCAPSRGRPPRTAWDPPPTTLLLCPYMVAVRLMALLWPGPDNPPETYPHLTEEDMPGIQRCFFSNPNYLPQTHPHILELTRTPP